MNLPIVGATYTHKNQNEYRVHLLANLDSERADYPPVVVYIGLRENKVWAKSIDRFNAGMTLTDEDSKDNAILYYFKTDARYPRCGETYKHHNGNEYIVMCIANTEAESEDYPVMVIYQGHNGKIWAKTVDNFLAKMTKVED